MKGYFTIDKKKCNFLKNNRTLFYFVKIIRITEDYQFQNTNAR